jgi:hypothetical protein
MGGMEETGQVLAAKFAVIFPHLDERQRRLLMGAEARALGHGGIRLVARAAGVREGTVSLGVSELEAGGEPLGRVRRPGGRRKRAADLDPGLLPALLALVEPDERGDPVTAGHHPAPPPRTAQGRHRRTSRRPTQNDRQAYPRRQPAPGTIPAYHPPSTKPPRQP